MFSLRLLSRSLPRSVGIPVSIHRTLFTTPRLALPAGRPRKSESAPQPTPRRKSKNTTPDANAASKKPKKTINKRLRAALPKPRPQITDADKPPRPPPSAFVIFYQKYLKSLGEQDTLNTLPDLSAKAKAAAAIWHQYTPAEKQPFLDENEVLRADYYKAREVYFRDVSSTTLREVNRLRTKRGKNKLKKPVPKEKRRPLSGFFRFLDEHRKSEEAMAAAAQVAEPKSRSFCMTVVRNAGEAWRGMSDAQKAPYLEESRVEMKKWKEGHLHA